MGISWLPGCFAVLFRSALSRNGEWEMWTRNPFPSHSTLNKKETSYAAMKLVNLWFRIVALLFDSMPCRNRSWREVLVTEPFFGDDCKWRQLKYSFDQVIMKAFGDCKTEIHKSFRRTIYKGQEVNSEQCIDICMKLKFTIPLLSDTKR